MSYVLAIDYGTSYTCAAIGRDGRAEVLSFGASSRFPSHVFLEADGSLSVGDVAENNAERAPERFERSPKRALGYQLLTLGEQEVEPVDAVAAVLRHVLTEAMRRQRDEPPAQVRLTHPAAWGDRRREALVEAARRAGIESPRLIAEPDAAAHHFARLPALEIRPGDVLSVYDLGGGTFDAAVLRCVAPDTFELAGPPGGTAGAPEGSAEIGGDEFDRRIYAYLGEQIAQRDPETWQRLRERRTGADNRARRVLRSDAQRAKERLSTMTSTSVWVERIEDDVVLTRERFNELIEDSVDTSIRIFEQTLAAAGVDKGQLSFLFLTGGSSRIPLVEGRVKSHFGRAETQDDPKAIVALGAAGMDGVAPVTAVEREVVQAQEQLRTQEQHRTQEYVTAPQTQTPPQTQTQRTPETATPKERPPRARSTSRWVTGTAIVLGAILACIYAIESPDVPVDRPMVVLAVALLALGLVRLSGRTAITGIPALLAVAGLGYVSFFVSLGDRMIGNRTALLVAVAGLLAVLAADGREAWPRWRGAPTSPRALRPGAITAAAGTAFFVIASFVKYGSIDASFWGPASRGALWQPVGLIAAAVALASAVAVIRRPAGGALVALAVAASYVGGLGLMYLDLLTREDYTDEFGPAFALPPIGGAIALAGALLVWRAVRAEPEGGPVEGAKA